jgi:hypothetical protein
VEEIMFGVLMSTRSVAVLRVDLNGRVTYRNVKSSRTAVIGHLPRQIQPEDVLQIAGRKPPFRSGYVLISTADSVFAAQMGRKMRLGEWQVVPR